MTPRLSILIPFYRDDPTVLLQSLQAQTIDPDQIEVLVMDDGTGDPTLSDQVQSIYADTDLPGRLITSPQNRGRSATRNALQDAARAEWVLFLDSDMRIDHEDFLDRYLDLIETDTCDIIFGGFDVEDQALDPDTDLHRVLSQRSDCMRADHRQKLGAQHVASSNLCIRKSVLLTEPFDPEFTGWGWEDSEWAARVSDRYRLRHIDNPAVHLGLETTDSLLSRFATSGANYHRFVNAHPALAKSLPLYRIVSRLKHFPGHRLARQPLKMLIRQHSLPIKLRVAALKLWRASHYAEAMK
jgi:glycosyltransferase involved in cell wall biosynthesis